jgi:hypothetical protein
MCQIGASPAETLMTKVHWTRAMWATRNVTAPRRRATRNVAPCNKVQAAQALAVRAPLAAIFRLRGLAHNLEHQRKRTRMAQGLERISTGVARLGSGRNKELSTDGLAEIAIPSPASPPDKSRCPHGQRLLFLQPE